MKNLNCILKCLTLVFVVGMFSMACKKGDAGAMGPQGEKGDAGAKGGNGAQGSTGTANVIYSDWASVKFTGTGSNYNGKITAAKLTKAIVDNGEVAVYAKLSYDTPTGDIVTYYKLNFLRNKGTSIQFIRIEPAVGSINLNANYNFIDDPRESYLFRYVLIPGGVKTTANLDLNDYKAVKKAFNLKD